MKLTESDLRNVYQTMTARQVAADCPGEDALIRLASGESNPRVVDHLARCSDCAREYQIARTLRSLEDGGERILRSPLRWIPLAAAAVIAVAALLVHREDRRTIASLESQLSTRRAPVIVKREQSPLLQIGTPIVDLDVDVTRGAAEGGGPTAIERSNVLTLILHLPEEMTGTVEVSVDGAPPMQASASPGAITLTLSGQSPGDHVVHVRSPKREVDFRFRIR